MRMSEPPSGAKNSVPVMEWLTDVKMQIVFQINYFMKDLVSLKIDQMQSF